MKTEKEENYEDLIEKCREIITCDSARIVKPLRRMFLIIGMKRNTSQDIGQWIGNDGKPFNFDYFQENVIASGHTETELIENVKKYVQLCGMTWEEYFDQIRAGKKNILCFDKQVPQRVQRSRKHPYHAPNKLPTVYVGRPSKYGNPFRVGKTYRNTAWLACMYNEMPFDEFIKEKNKGITPKTIDECLELYELHIQTLIRMYGINYFAPLKGKNLSCWCPLDQKCHADILLKMVNY